MKLSLSLNVFAICRLEPDAEIPSWALKGSFFSLNRTTDELSIVCEQKNVPTTVKSEKEWRLFKVEGPLDFSLTGILASIANPLAQSKVSIFAISTFDTDYIMVKSSSLQAAIESLTSEGFSIN
jgi:uncharacterized protein